MAADYCRDRVRAAFCGTAPLTPELKDEFSERWGIPLHDTYGLSETLLSVASTPTRPARPGTVGRALPGVELRIRAVDKSVAGPGEVGVIEISTPDLTLGYLEPGERIQFSLPLADGTWFDTGDIGSIDASGDLTISGRAKELIIRGGVNISPSEIERVLEQEPGAASVAVVGVPHALLGEDVAAVVAVDDGLGLESIEGALRTRAKEELQPAQQPSVYLQIDALPTTTTGKVRKGVLRDLVIDRLGLPPEGKGFELDWGAEPAAAAPDRLGEWAGPPVDLSHSLHEEMTTFPSPNHPRLELTELARHETEGRATRRLVIGTHTGTHVDAPLHFLPDTRSVERLDLEALVGPAAVADLSGTDPLTEVGVERLAAALGGEPKHPRVILRFDWSRRFGDVDEFYGRSPYLSTEAVTWLVARGVRLLGMDTPSPDDPRNGFGSGNDSPNHKILLEAEVVLLEYLNNLDRLDADQVFLVALPLNLAGADGCPARAIAFLPAR